MPNRAIVISIANYPDADIGKQLPGTEESADKFHDWLVQERQVAAANIVRLKDIDRLKLEKAFRDLVDRGQDTTERLFVFFSGHGLSFQDAPGKQRPADILVGGDFENLQDSGQSCLKLSDLQDKLFDCLGPGEHFYFIDACRNLVNASELSPTNIGWTRPQSAPGTDNAPAIYTLFSTERLSMAVDNSVFAVQLVEGLSGKGRAKRYEGPRLVVTFNSLCDYLKRIRPRNIDYSAVGKGNGELVEIQPIPSFQCRVDVVNAAPTDQFTLTVQNARQHTIGAPQTFAGTMTSIRQPPDDYYLTVQHTTEAVQPVASNHADLYDDCTVAFKKVTAAPPPFPQPAVQPATVSLTASPGTTLLIENVRTGDVTRSNRAYDGPLAPGEYYVRLKANEGRTLRCRRVSVAAGGDVVVDIAARASSPVKDALLAAIPAGVHDTSEVDFSETLHGRMPDDDLGLWLAIIGASRIVGRQGEFSKLGQLPLPAIVRD